MRVGSLFAGIGGFDLAARNVGWSTAWFSEIEPYACQVLEKNFPGVPNHGDITQIDFTRVEPVEVLCGGFPCQDISTAGGRSGLDGTRSGLWRDYRRAIGDLRPRFVVVENVAALRFTGRGLDRVLGDLATLGYDAEWHCIPASAVGAPHVRDRIWIVAYPSGLGHGARGRTSDLLEAAWGPHGPVRPEPRGAGASASYLASHLSVAFQRHAAAGWPAEPPVGRMVDGLPNGMDRLSGLGNAIMPQIAEAIFQIIQEAA